MNYINAFNKQGLVHPFLLIIYFIIYGVNIFHPEGKEWMELSLFLLSLILALIPLLFLINLR